MIESELIAQFEIRKISLILGCVQNMFIFSVSNSTYDSLNIILGESWKNLFLVVKQSLGKPHYNAVFLFQSLKNPPII